MKDDYSYLIGTTVGDIVKIDNREWLCISYNQETRCEFTQAHDFVSWYTYPGPINTYHYYEFKETSAAYPKQGDTITCGFYKNQLIFFRTNNIGI